MRQQKTLFSLTRQLHYFININDCSVKEFASKEMIAYLLGKVEGKVDTDYAHYLYDYHGISLDVSIEYTEELRNGDFKDISHLVGKATVHNVFDDEVVQGYLWSAYKPSTSTSSYLIIDSEDEDEIPVRRSYVKRK